MSASARPESIYPLRRDRTVSLRNAGQEVVAGFRVHYRISGDAPSTHRVSDILWEHEAHDFAATISATEGMYLMTCGSRPDGVEKVRGVNSRPMKDPMPDSMDHYRRKSADYGQRFRSEQDMAKKLLLVSTFKLRVLDPLENVPDKQAECLAIFNGEEAS